MGISGSSLVHRRRSVRALDPRLAAGGRGVVVLLPTPRPGLMQTGSAFGARLVGLVSHVPGGIGVFESLMLLFMRPSLTPSQMAPALIAFRAIYYFAPFAVAVTAIALDESRRNRSALGRAGSLAASIGAWVTPKLLAAATFVAGTMLILSGATPAIGSRLAWVARFVPFPLLEISHFLGSVVGVALLFHKKAQRQPASPQRAAQDVPILRRRSKGQLAGRRATRRGGVQTSGRDRGGLDRRHLRGGREREKHG